MCKSTSLAFYLYRPLNAISLYVITDCIMLNSSIVHYSSENKTSDYHN
jgi:hypothetical protein